jgi:hypothetical protein
MNPAGTRFRLLGSHRQVRGIPGLEVPLDAQKTSWISPDTVREYQVVHDLRHVSHAHTSTIPVYSSKISSIHPSLFFSVLITHRAFPFRASLSAQLPRRRNSALSLGVSHALAPAYLLIGEQQHEAACTSIPCSPRHCGNVATPSRYLVVA